MQPTCEQTCQHTLRNRRHGKKTRKEHTERTYKTTTWRATTVSESRLNIVLPPPAPCGSSLERLTPVLTETQQHRSLATPLTRSHHVFTASGCRSFITSPHIDQTSTIGRDTWHPRIALLIQPPGDRCLHRSEFSGEFACELTREPPENPSTFWPEHNSPTTDDQCRSPLSPSVSPHPYVHHPLTSRTLDRRTEDYPKSFRQTGNSHFSNRSIVLKLNAILVVKTLPVQLREFNAVRSAICEISLFPVCQDRIFEFTLL